MNEPTTSYDVRVWAVRRYPRAKGTTYGVRWSVAGRAHHRTHQTRALADSFRAELLSAARTGTPFDVESGQPVTMLPAATTPSWYTHARAFVTMKWPHLAPRSRQSIADALATATPALLSTDRSRPEPRALRAALYQWAYHAGRTPQESPPNQVQAALAWVAANTVPISDLADPIVTRRVLHALSVTMAGQPAAANTVARRRAAVHSCADYAVELGHLSIHPFTRVKWTAPKVAEVVDSRVVVNHRQAQNLLAAVHADGPTGQRLYAFFGCLYYAAMRPGEAAALVDTALELPPPDRDDEWGDLRFGDSTPAGGRDWSDTRTRETRGLKHRARDDVRHAPCPPPLVTMLRWHLTTFGTDHRGRLFRGTRSADLSTSVYERVWKRARDAALTPTEAASPLAHRPYDLRHAAVSTWLNAGVDPTQVAEWAGHSVAVLLRVYAKCIVGRDHIARRRITDILNEDGAA